MKRVIVAGLLLAGLVSLSAQQSITRFAVVDMNKIAAAFPGGSPASSQSFNEKSARVQAEIDRLNGELQELNTKLTAAKEEEKKDQIRTLENQIKAKTQSIQNYIKTSFAELERERTNLLRNDSFVTELNAVLKAVAESEGYSMVLSKQEGSGILWYSPSVDITNKVIERIKSRAGGGR